ncbi:site-2 protease family protein [Portibacter marinus]|uniref:site-2 protease family protein n=1 Tax=Portibacter marinus TaxID=2898660 RepID=UPI001F3A0B21|nr:site-2 protease family protein [Portibacter marinus]
MFSKGSLHLGNYAGIPLKVHWTFIFIIFLVLGIGISRDRAPVEVSVILLLVGISFFCVILHEYGHALMARRFNVRTIDIILSPIGGLARLERLPSKPMHEFFIAIAGPLVNVAIALLISLILLIGGKPVLIDLNSSVSNFDNWGAYLSIVLYINLLLFVFNLIPAFPMDGGRILRSLLSIKLGKKRSTDIASWIGYTIAIGFVITGFFISYYTLSVIGIFVMFMARGEKISARQEDFLTKNHSGMEGLMTHHRFHPDDMMSDIITHYRSESARNFMVFNEDEELQGVITEPAIRACIQDQAYSSPVSQFTEPSFQIIEPGNLQAALSYMNAFRARYVLVKLGDNAFGMLERYKIVQRMNAG